LALPPDLKARVLAAAASRQAPTRRKVVRRSVTVTIIAWAVAFGIFEFFGGLRMTGRPVPLLLGTVLGTSVIAAAAAWVSLSNGRSTLGRLPRLMLPAAIGAPPMILAWKVFYSARFPGALDQWITRPGFKCLGLSLAIAACPLAAFVISRRFSDPRHPVLTGVIGGLAIGSLTNVLTDLWCPVAYIPHLLLGHVLPVAILGAIGGWLGRQVIALRHE
jgi:hypothetical protein